MAWAEGWAGGGGGGWGEFGGVMCGHFSEGVA